MGNLQFKQPTVVQSREAAKDAVSFRPSIFLCVEKSTQNDDY